MKHKLQDELSRLTLSEQKKRGIIENVERSETPLLVKLTLPLFASVVLFVVMLLTIDQSPLLPQKAASATWRTELLEHASHYVWWIIVTAILLVSWLVQLVIQPLYTKRMAHISWVIRYRATLLHSRWRYATYVVVAMVVASLVYMGLTIPLSFHTPEHVYSSFIYFLLMLNYTTYLHWRTRKAQLPVCPHCQAQLTKKDVRKLMWKTYEARCIHCNERVYQTKESRQASMFAMFYLVLLMLAQWLHIPFALALLTYVVGYVYMYYYFFPYTIVYGKEEQFLW